MEESVTVIKWNSGGHGTSEYHRMLLSPANGQYILCYQKKRGTTGNWSTKETYDVEELESVLGLEDK